MEMVLAGLGMLACLAVMMVVMPLGMKAVGRLRGRAAKPEERQAPHSQDESLGHR
jgi:hypothetical protein